MVPCLANPAVAQVDPNKMQELWPINSGGDVAVSGDGQYIAIVTGNNVYLYDQGGQNPLWTFSADIPFDKVAISKDGQYVAASGPKPYSNTALIYLFDHAGTQLWPKDTGIGTGVWNIAISDDGNYISFGSNGKLYLYDRSGWIWSKTPGLGYGPAVISGDGRYVCGVSSNGIVYYDHASML